MIYQGEALSVQLLQDGIAELSFDSKGSVNKLDRATLLSLEQAVTALEQTPDLHGLMLTSRKDAFIVGADITEFLDMFDLPQARLDEWLSQANRIFNRIEVCSKMPGRTRPAPRRVHGLNCVSEVLAVG